MVTATKTSSYSVTNNMDLAFKSSKTNSTDATTSELYKTDNNSAASKNEDFKKVLDSKTNSKDQDDTQKVDSVKNGDNAAKDSNEVKDTNNKDIKDTDINELKEKLEELEKESKSGDKDKISDILTELLSLLAKLGINQGNLKSDDKINPDILKKLVEDINNNSNVIKSSDNNLNDVMAKIMELLKNDSVKNALDTDSLKNMEKILSNLSSSLEEDNTATTKDVKSNLKNLMSEISNILDNKQDQTKKVLTLEDMLNKNYSQNNSEDSSAEDSSSSNTTTADSKNSKGISKEDKFLNSLIDNNKDDSLNKINLFASRTSAIQNQGVNSARGLAIDKATFTDDLIKDVKFMTTNSLKELTVKVNPNNLGEITIKLVQQEDGLMKANLKANSKETAALLSQNLTEIKKQLSEQNIKITDVNVELYQEDTTFFKDQGFEGQLAGDQNQQRSSTQNNSSNSQVSSNEETDENLAKVNNNVNFFA